MMHDKVTVLAQPANVPVAARRTCVLVLGMHRSGTSALARVLNLLGCDLPKTLIGANKSNETGHWESEPMARFNDRLLASAGSTWDDWMAFNPQWFSSPKAAQFHEEAIALLQEEFGASRFFVMKDPRICRLAPFWMNVLAAHGTAVRTILPVRNPIEVGRSLAVRNKFEPALGHLLWLRHALEAEYATRGRPRYFVSYEGLLKNWAGVAAEAATALELSWPAGSVSVDAAVSSFLDQKYRHHQETVEDTLGNPNLPSWLRDAFKVFSAWTASGERQQDFDVLDQIRTEFDAAAPAFAAVVHSGRKAAQGLTKLQGEQKALTEAKEAGERAIAELQADKAALAISVTASEQALAGLKAERESLAESVQAGQRTISKLQAVLMEKDRIAELRAATIAQNEAALADASKCLSEAVAIAARKDQEIEDLRARLADSESWVFRLSSERAALQGTERGLQRQIEDQAIRLRDTSEELNAARNEIGRLKIGSADIENALAAALARQQQGEEALAAALEANKELARQLSVGRGEIDGVLRKLRDAERARGDGEVEKALRKELAEKEAGLKRRFDEIAALTRALREKETELSGFNEKLRKHEKALREKDASGAALKKSLADMKAQKDREIAKIKLVEEQLSARFEEIAQLTRLVNEAEASARSAASERDSILAIAAVLAADTRSWRGKLLAVAPAGLRRAHLMRQLKIKGLFDARAYLANHPDVAKSKFDPLHHYVRHGIKEGRALNIQDVGRK